MSHVEHSEIPGPQHTLALAAPPGHPLCRVWWDTPAHINLGSNHSHKAIPVLSMPGHPSLHPFQLYLFYQGAPCAGHSEIHWTMPHLGSSRPTRMPFTQSTLGHPSWHLSIHPFQLQLPCQGFLCTKSPRIMVAYTHFRSNHPTRGASAQSALMAPASQPKSPGTPSLHMG